MTKSYLDQVAEIVGEPVRIMRFGVESYMSKVDEEGRFSIFTVAPKPVSRLARIMHGEVLHEHEYRSWTLSINERPEFVAEFTLVAMPGCCGAVVSTNSFVNEMYRSRGLGTLLNEMRRQMAHEYGYGIMLCTDLVTNEAQQKVLHRNGWTRGCTFQNPRTLHTIDMHFVHLMDTGAKLGFDLRSM